MGAYINPKNGQTKEAWLKENATSGSWEAPESIDGMPGHLPVCIVDNGMFTAAGIAFDERELSAFKEPGDMREKLWFWVEKEKLMDPNVSDLHFYLK